MPSLRSKLIKQTFKHSKLLSKAVTQQNLAAKRARYTRNQRLFPLQRDVHITAVQQPGFKGEWLDTPSSRPNKVLLYFHGGGFIFDSSKLHRDLIARLAIAGQTRALSVHYSLAPEHPYPTAAHEALAAYRWLLKQFAATDIVVAGDSAGGSLALSLLHLIRTHHLPYPACAVVLSPATDAANVDVEAKQRPINDHFIRRENLDFFMDAYFAATPRNHPVASPLYGDLHGFPPLLIHVDKDELMYRQSAAFATKARAAGVDVTLYTAHGLWHVWHLFARYVPEAKQAIRQIGIFVRSHLG